MTYKGPPKREQPVQPVEFVRCQGCTTERKCNDMRQCGFAADERPKQGAGTARTHDLKCWPEYFEPVRDRQKTFEIRKNDRDFHAGDRLYLREFIPCPKCMGSGRVWDNGDKTNCDCHQPHGIYTGRIDIHVVTYVMDDFPGLQEGYVAMGLRPVFK